jgi:sarcosine oxidase
LDHGDPAVLDEIEASLRDGRWAVERLGPEEAAERWPGMAFDRAVLYSPDGGRVFAERSVAAAVRAAVAAGARFQDRTPVDAIERTAEGVRVHASGGTWSAGSVVLCAGPWLPGLADGLVPLPPLTVTQQQPVHFAIRDGLHFPSFIHHSGGGVSLSFGAYGLESPGEGVKVGIESTIRTVTTSTRTFDEDPAVTAAARDYAQRWLPGADTSRHTAATCLFTETEDSHFVLERHGAVVVCSPCSGHGFKFAPVIGDRAARLAMGDDAVPPLPQGS